MGKGRARSGGDMGMTSAGCGPTRVGVSNMQATLDSDSNGPSCNRRKALSLGSASESCGAGGGHINGTWACSGKCKVQGSGVDIGNRKASAGRGGCSGTMDTGSCLGTGASGRANGAAEIGSTGSRGAGSGPSGIGVGSRKASLGGKL